MQYDNGEIDEEDLSEKDIDKLIELYEEKTEELNRDTEKRKKSYCLYAKRIKKCRVV